MMEDRFKLLVGEDNFSKISDLNILVIGLGGVGGYVVESLVRSSIKSITIVDGDVVDITNLNRQLIATTKTIGLKKVEATSTRIKEVNPSIKVYEHDLVVTKDNIDYIFDKDYHYVIDCIDDISAKIEIIKKCAKDKLNLIIATGTGKKIDASKLFITTLDKTTHDPLAKVLRNRLKKEGLSTKITCTSSTEQPKEIKGTMIPSNSYVPATAGLLITSYIINDIIAKN